MSRIDFHDIYAGGSGSVLQNISGIGAIRAPVLRAIDLRYTDRDHFVGLMSARPRFSTSLGRGDYELILHGRSQNEPGAVDLSFADLSSWGVSFESVSDNDCRGINHVIPIRTFSPDEIFVLSGFSFDFGSGNDHQIQRVAVKPKPYQGRIEVSFGHFNATGPYRTIVNWVALPWRHFGRTAPDEPGYRHPLQRFTDENFVGSTSGPRSNPRSAGLISGFAFKFLNGVQNFQRLVIDVSGSRVETTYRGNAPGQPAAGSVEYVNWMLPIN